MTRALLFFAVAVATSLLHPAIAQELPSNEKDTATMMDNLLINPKLFRNPVKLLVILKNIGLANRFCRPCEKNMTNAEYALRSIAVVLDGLSKGSMINVVFTDDEGFDYAMFPDYLDIDQAKGKIPTWDSVHKYLNDGRIDIASFCAVKMASTYDGGMRTVLNNLTKIGGAPTASVFFTDGIMGNLEIDKIMKEKFAAQSTTFPIYYKIRYSSDHEIGVLKKILQLEITENEAQLKRDQAQLKRHLNSSKKQRDKRRKDLIPDEISALEMEISHRGKIIDRYKAFLKSPELTSEFFMPYFDIVPKTSEFILPQKYDLSDF